MSSRVKNVLAAIALVLAIGLIIFIPMVARAADPAEPCGISAGGYDTLLEGTELHGIGRQLEAGERLYGVNGLFVAAVIAHESGWGTSRLAQECNNLGGIKGGDGYRDFATREICVLYMFSLFDRLYIGQGRGSIDEIGEMYCETDDWAGSVGEIMDGLERAAGETRD
jgi:hypothetical protein